MPIDAVTANRNYPLPEGSNDLSHDIVRLIAALEAVDVDVASVLATLVQKAPKLNPVFTGTATSTTPAVNDNSTKIATTAWARLYFADFIGAAPEALDTIAELAAALDNNPDTIHNLTTLVATKLAKDQNLNDVQDKTVARTNLSVYSKTEGDGRVATLLNATAKATPVDADRVFGGDSAAVNGLVYNTWAQIKAFLKTYFDGLYQAKSTVLAALAGVGAAVSGDVIYASGAGAWARLAKGTAFQALIMNSGATAPQWATLPFTQSYDSSQQTITSGGALTLAHGLGVKPKLIIAAWQCTTAENGYSIGDEVQLGIYTTTDAASNSRGVVVIPDATYLNVRFANLVTTITLSLHKTTGAPVGFVNANWKFVVRAWA